MTFASTRPAKVPAQSRGCPGRTDHVPASVKPQHDRVVARLAGLDVQDGHAAKLSGGGRDVVGERLCAQHLFEVRTLLDRVASDVERGVAKYVLECVFLLLAHGRLFRVGCGHAVPTPAVRKPDSWHMACQVKNLSPRVKFAQGARSSFHSDT